MLPRGFLYITGKNVHVHAYKKYQGASKEYLAKQSFSLYASETAKLIAQGTAHNQQQMIACAPMLFLFIPNISIPKMTTFL